MTLQLNDDDCWELILRLKPGENENVPIFISQPVGVCFPPI